MRIALATPRPAATIPDALARVRVLMERAAADGAAIVCFPESYVPGLRGQEFTVPDFTAADFAHVTTVVGEWARELHLATILGTERPTPAGRENLALVFDRTGRVLGVQTKNQLDPTEDPLYIPGTHREVFEVDGVTFGVVICHEGWRYPETVRWAAVRGAAIVFHPQQTGGDRSGSVPIAWGHPDAPYYEQAMAMRARENTIWFASVNYALQRQESATSLVAPDGRCVAYLSRDEEGVLVAEIDPALATGLLARRYAPERYQTVAPNA